jgi:nitrogenase molybdenum-iron protein alpha/beta subunit
MVDSHKYCADGRAALFGEPDFVYAMTMLCTENGIIPMVAATGSVCPELAPMLKNEVEACAAGQLVSGSVILDDCDFATIETLCRETGVNVLIGSSDGRRIAHKLDIGLVRCAFSHS